MNTFTWKQGERNVSLVIRATDFDKQNELWTSNVAQWNPDSVKYRQGSFEKLCRCG